MRRARCALQNTPLNKKSDVERCERLAQRSVGSVSSLLSGSSIKCRTHFCECSGGGGVHLLCFPPLMLIFRQLASPGPQTFTCSDDLLKRHILQTVLAADEWALNDLELLPPGA